MFILTLHKQFTFETKPHSGTIYSNKVKCTLLSKLEAMVILNVHLGRAGHNVKFVKD